MADHVAPALEAILMVAEEPLPPALLAKLVGAPINEVEEICENLAAEYIADGRGFILARVAGDIASRPPPSRRPTSNVSFSMASRLGCRRRRSRRLP